MNIPENFFLCAVVVALWSSVAAAQEQSFNYELTPYGAYRFGGEFNDADSDVSIELEDSSSFGLIFNAMHSPNTQWEVLYSRQETDAKTNGLGISDTSLNLSVEHLQAGGTYQWDEATVRPYLAATLGLSRVKVSNEGFSDDSFFAFSMGLGMQIRPTERLGIRLEARGFGTVLNSESDIFCKTGPDNNFCAIRIDGTIMWQLETFAGLVFRF